VTVNPAGSAISVASPLNPAGYRDGVNFLASLPSDATGSVIFLANNIPFSTNALVGGSTSSDTITFLPRGTNIITARYPGDGKYLGSTNTLSGGQIVTNHPPVAGTFVYTSSTKYFKVVIANLLTNVTDADGDAIIRRFQRHVGFPRQLQRLWQEAGHRLIPAGLDAVTGEILIEARAIG
jgi:hypothetical protein